MQGRHTGPIALKQAGPMWRFLFLNKNQQRVDIAVRKKDEAAIAFLQNV